MPPQPNPRGALSAIEWPIGPNSIDINGDRASQCRSDWLAIYSKAENSLSLVRFGNNGNWEKKQSSSSVGQDPILTGNGLWTVLRLCQENKCQSGCQEHCFDLENRSRRSQKKSSPLKIDVQVKIAHERSKTLGRQVTSILKTWDYADSTCW
jgi:hypothetical protein